MNTTMGEALRRLRVKGSERIIDMAERLKLSAGFISALETSRESAPVGFEERVIKAYHLIGVDAADLRQAADRSRTTFWIKANSQLAKDVAGRMARGLNAIPISDLEAILLILSRQDDNMAEGKAVSSATNATFGESEAVRAAKDTDPLAVI